MNKLTFEQAIAEAKQGKTITRKGWRGIGAQIKVVMPRSYESPYFQMNLLEPVRTLPQYSKWNPTPGDMFSNDWEVVPPEVQVDIEDVIEQETKPKQPERYVCLNGKQLRDLVEFVCPDGGDTDELETEVSIRYFYNKSIDDETQEVLQPGYYACLAEYPEEGSIYLDAEVKVSE